MNLGIGSKLFLASVGVIVVVEASAAVVLRAEVRDTLESRAAIQLAAQAESARIALEHAPDPGDAQPLVAALARATGAQVEVVTADGVVVADSAEGGVHDPLALPEIDAALRTGRGQARRGGRLLAATRFERDGRVAVVRVARALDEVQDAYDRLWVLLSIGAIIGLVVAVGMTLIATILVRRALRQLASSAATVAAGGARRVELEAVGEIGAVGGFINRMADDAERTVTALSSERALLGSVLDSMTQGVIALDNDRRMTVVNPAARTILDLPGVPVGEPFIDQVRIPAALALVEGTTGTTAEFSTPAGIRVLARVAPQRDGEGLILILDDVTAIRRLETVRRDFVANVSHELRTPVSVIQANAETLQGGAKDDPAFADRLIEGLHRNAVRLSRIIADLLDLSRLEGGPELELAAVSVGLAARGALASLGPQATGEVNVAVEVADDVEVLADGDSLDQVLVNLLDNAVKYTPAGGHVWVRTRPSGSRVRIEVVDDGPGIAPHQRERIFERFYRIDPGRSRALGGTGLGLAIVKHLVEGMGGQVGVDANQPTGSLFWIELDRP